MPHYCENCRGSDFQTIDGYFYCKECGTQSQVQQVEMEAEAVMLGDRTIGGEVVRLKTDNKLRENESRITSWEEYNYILVGLVDELINLGANNRFKKTVLKLWTRYLQVIEAAFFSLYDECLPRLPANYHKRDAEILYNKHHRKRRRRSSVHSQDTCETKSSTGKADSVIKSFNISKILKKTKEELARTQYEDFKKLENDSESVSLSLATSSQRSSADDKSNVSLNLTFTQNARRVFKGRMRKNHLRKHESDHEDALECHKTRIKRHERDKLETLDNSILIGIIYLALNLTQDDIQASDLIRFLREGHVSSFNIKHFLPENIKSEGHSDFESLSRRAFYNHFTLRTTCAKLCRDMSILEVVRPDLSALVCRYVDELELPEELKFYAENLMAFDPPLMEFNQQTKCKIFLPNYEGRAISYIIFLMKVLFGLDDDREVKISETARVINGLFPEDPHLQLFVVEDWLRKLKTRQMVVEKHHLPSALRQPWKEEGNLTSGVGNWQMYVDHLKTIYESKMEGEKQLKSDTDRTGVAHNTMALLHGISQQKRLNEEEDKEKVCPKSHSFKASMTPYREYSHELLEENSRNRRFISDGVERLLAQDFSLSSLKVFYGDNISIESLRLELKRRCSLRLKVRELGLNTRHLNIVNCDRFELNRDAPSLVQLEFVTEREFAKLNKKERVRYTEEEILQPKMEMNPPLESSEILLHVSNMDYWSHYIPYKTLRNPFQRDSHQEVMKLLPNNFKFLLFECARIIEQDPKHLLLELALLERKLIFERKDMEKPKGYVLPPPLHLW